MSSVLDNILQYEEDINQMREQDEVQDPDQPLMPNQPSTYVEPTKAHQSNQVESQDKAERPDCKHNQVFGEIASGAICLDCNEHLSSGEIKELDFRQFGLLHGSQKEYFRAEYGKTQVQAKKRSLMEEKKLVLVLDLDNTLLHSELFEVGKRFIPRGASQPMMISCQRTCPIMKQMYSHQHRSRRQQVQGGFHVLDANKSLYHIWEPGLFSHRCKLRPFCAEFLISAMQDYEVHFNTAATRIYGLRILQVLRAELLSKKDEAEDSDPNWLNQVDLTFCEQRLITRDDKAKYTAGGSAETKSDLYRKAESILISKGEAFTPQQLEREVDRLNFTRKSLDALAGGDDTFFVILDDREDVWPTEVKLFDSGVPQVLPSENLLRIPPYFYFDDQNWRMNCANDWLFKSIREIHLEREFDMTLAVYLRHLRKVHEKFFENQIDKPEELLDTKFYVRKLKNEVFFCSEMISFERIIKKDVELSRTFEGQKCDTFNLMATQNLKKQLDRNEGTTGIVLVHDKISEQEEQRIAAKYPVERVKLVGALWFYLSIHFNVELPMSIFEPAAQRASQAEDPSQASETTTVQTENTASLIRRLLKACLPYFNVQKGETLCRDWPAIQSETFTKIQLAREERHQKQIEEAKEQEAQRQAGEKAAASVHIGTTDTAAVQEAEDGEFHEEDGQLEKRQKPDVAEASEDKD